MLPNVVSIMRRLITSFEQLNIRRSGVQLIFCLGHPRGGLSVLGGCLRTLGLNSAGSATVSCEINRLLFQELGISAYLGGPLPNGWLESYPSAKARARIGSLLKGFSTRGQLCFVADPLFCRVLPLWQQVVRELGIKEKYVFMVRHPWEVAKSLAEKGEVDIAKGHIIWLSSTRDALRALEGLEYSLINFDQLLADPVSVINAILYARSSDLSTGSAYDGMNNNSRFVGEEERDPRPDGLICSRDKVGVYSSLLEFVQPKLKRHHAGRAPMNDRKRFAPFVRLYETLRLRQGEADTSMPGSSQNVAESSSKDDFGADGAVLDLMLRTMGEYETKKSDFDIGEALLSQASHIDKPLYAKLLMPSGETRFSERSCVLIPDQWQKASFDWSSAYLRSGEPLRFCPLNMYGYVSIAAVKIINQATGEVMWSLRQFDDKNLCYIEGTALRIPNKEKLELVVSGDSAFIIFEGLKRIPECPLVVEVWMRVSRGLDKGHETISAFLDIVNWRIALDLRQEKENVRNLLSFGDLLEKGGFSSEADSFLVKCATQYPESHELLIACAEAAMKRMDWTEAIKRWQDIVVLQGSNTSAHIYERMDLAYQEQKSFPKGTIEEEHRLGDQDKHQLLLFIHQNLEPEMYLEIGVSMGKSLALARSKAIGVDPMPHVAVPLSEQAKIVTMSSDDFFKVTAKELLGQHPDLVFVDGMHLFEFALRDFINVERFAAPWTLVVIDDIFPAHPAQAERHRRTRAWAGDIWKLYEVLKKHRPELILLPINASPTGVLLIAGLRQGNQVLQKNYDVIVREYSKDMDVPTWILKRDGALSTRDEAIKGILTLLKSARLDLLDSEKICRNLANALKRSEVFERSTDNPSRGHAEVL
jgi:hypothetical protein